MKRLQRKRTPALIYILHSGNLYGTERMALATIGGMDEYDKRVVFAPLPGGKASVAVAAREAGFESVVFHSKWELVKGLMPWFLRYRSVDIIGTGVSQSFICYALAKLSGVKVRQLQVAHGGTAELHAYGRKRYLNHIPVHLVAVSEFVRDKLVKHGVRPNTISVIDNFLSDAQRHDYQARAPYDPRAEGARPIDPSCVKVAVVSRVDRIKRIDLLLDAVAGQGLAEFQFDIYGTGEELDVLRERAAALPNVHFHGFISDVKDRLVEADFLLHLCPEEPFGLVILEAFLSRLLVIVPNAGGAGSLVEDGVTGLRFQADDIFDLREVLQAARAMSGPDQQSLANRGRAALDARFSQEEGLRRYREALRGAAF
ncbi:MAG: glycosyltransferase family 4 protein [Pseudomonadota bacterium]|nr:glycosyltransferase family 4 protein [Pseudomonadota bacterium]